MVKATGRKLKLELPESTGLAGHLPMRAATYAELEQQQKDALTAYLGAAGTGSSMEPYLSNDLWFEIFRRLPIKSLCRFRCVCKSWRSLFTSRFFIGLHGDYSYAPPMHDPPLHSLYNVVPDDTHVRRHVTYIHPLDDVGSYLRLKVIDIIHGVVCLASHDKSSTIFWNPTTCKYISVKNKNQIYNGCPFDMGFGYDGRKHDFKVVMTALPWYNVFSVGGGFWRESKANNVRGYKTNPTCGVCFTNGTIHWIARTKGDDDWLHDFSYEHEVARDTICTFALLLFDCEREEFQTMELPQQLIPNGPDRMACDLVQLFTYHDMVSALKKTPSQYNRCYDLWIMEEHGVASTWKKLFKIDEWPCVSNQVVMLGRDGVISQPSAKESSLYRPTPFQHFDTSRPQIMNGQTFVESWALEDVMQQHRGRDAKTDKGRDGKVYLYGAVRLINSIYGCLLNLLQRTNSWYSS